MNCGNRSFHPNVFATSASGVPSIILTINDGSKDFHVNGVPVSIFPPSIRLTIHVGSNFFQVNTAVTASLPAASIISRMN